MKNDGLDAYARVGQPEYGHCILITFGTKPGHPSAPYAWQAAALCPSCHAHGRRCQVRRLPPSTWASGAEGEGRDGRAVVVANELLYSLGLCTK
jgi:hypothetical protein